MQSGRNVVAIAQKAGENHVARSTWPIFLLVK